MDNQIKNFDISQSIEELKEWSEKYLEEGKPVFEASKEAVEDLLDVSGDFNTFHTKKGFQSYISDKRYKEFLDEIVSEVEPEENSWSKKRGERDLDYFNGAILPGMTYFTLLGLKNDFKSMEGEWNNPAWIGDEIILEKAGERFIAKSSTPESDEWYETGSFNFSGSNSNYNLEKTAVANQVVGRRDRKGDMLLNLSIDFYEEGLKDLEWSNLGLSLGDKQIKDLPGGELRSYDSKVIIDGNEVGEVQETFLDTDNYESIEREYRNVFNPFNPFEWTRLGLEANKAFWENFDYA